MSIDSETAATSLDPNTLNRPIEALLLAHSPSFDPWASPSGPRSPEESKETIGEADEPQTQSYAHTVLDEFDPLADKNKEVEQAWAQVESHPPPQTPPKDPQEVEEESTS